MPYDRANLPEGFQRGNTWGSVADPAYHTLAARFRPLFERIRANSVARELGRELPVEEIKWLRGGLHGLARAAGGGGAAAPASPPSSHCSTKPKCNRKAWVRLESASDRSVRRVRERMTCPSFR
jgi:hypothetical protein